MYSNSMQIIAQNRWSTLSFELGGVSRRRESIKRSALVLHDLVEPSYPSYNLSHENETARVQFHEIKGSRAHSSSATNPHTEDSIISE